MRDPQAPSVADGDPVPGPAVLRQVALDLEGVSWPAPEEIRARSRRRTRVRATVGAVPVVLVLAMVFGYLAPLGGPDGSPPDVPAALPAGPGGERVEIPDSAVLQPEDVGPGLYARHPVGLDLDGSRIDLDKLPYKGPSPLPRCYWGPPWPHSTWARPYNATKILFDPEAGISSPVVASQWVFRQPVEDASSAFDELRQKVSECASYKTSIVPRKSDAPFRLLEGIDTWKVLDDGFVGDESLLVEHRTVVEEDEIEPVRVHMYVALRFGDLYAVMVLVSDDRQRTDAIVARAVERLCTVANSGC
ncbi:hypothetical protein [Polymorphospora sp. NPDC050346]|uniref:hypothetical protein n=1 Tax=Polymorphospora sp. NPDC050346 TaxID=3155780 RepID=UPI0033EDB4B0